ncbi:MAG: glycoside hydrolase family 3 N-terminal domain-containing protein [Cellulosilyticaceae bacterium]
MVKYPFQNEKLDIEERIQDLVSRMTLEEKVRQLDIYSWSEFKEDYDEFDLEKFLSVSGETNIGCLQNRYSNAAQNNRIQREALKTSRLPIPILFSEEALHGLIWPDCTVFPQQIALASTFDAELGFKQGRAIAKECRSFGIHETWSPVLDLARDPRWGRVEEAYGEDTYLASRFAEEMVKGLQGDDLTSQDSIVAEVKHFSGYGAPTGGLNCAPAMMGKHEHEFYCLPVFEAAFKAGALNTMCSYNSIDGIPVAGDRKLLTDKLRGELGMKGFVRADMTAIIMLHRCHFVVESQKEAIRMAIEAGVDMQLYDFPHEVYQGHLMDLVKEGGLDEAVVNLSVSRVLRVKFMLGLFENPYVDEALSEKVVHCDEHVAIAREVAQKAICLLENKNNLLPLKKDIKTLAVIGPSAATPRFGDYSAPAEGCKSAVTVLEGIQNAVSEDTEVLYAKGCNILESEVMVIPASWLKTADGREGLTAEYFNSVTFEEVPVITKVDPQINFNWIYSKPAEGVNADHFAVRWTGILAPQETIDGFIGLSSMDSMRLWIDGELVVDGWGENLASQMKPFLFEKGKEYDVKIEFMNDQRGVRVIFGYNTGNSDMENAIAIATQADVAIVAVGDSEETCGENLDRADLNLPGRQLELVRKIYETGTPVVLVLQNGRPLSITWEAEHIPAIIEAWHVGEQGGHAIADVIFGDVNPAGRLPISFPKSVGQIPVHYNRRPFGATKYVEMDWNPLYPFGFGKSYTEFKYENLKLSSETIAQSETIKVSVDVTNVGSLYGEEVPQLYIHDTVSSVVRPYKELAGFERIGLQAGETKTVTFELGERQLRVLNPDFEWVVEKGQFEVMVGPNAIDLPLQTTFRVQ